MLTSSALNTSNIKTTAITTVSKVASVAVNGFKAAMRGLASATLVGAAIAGISFVLEKVISKFDSASNAAENYKMQQDTLKQTIESMGGTGEIDKLIDKYGQLEEKMRSGKSFDDTEAAQYKETVSQIKNIFPDLVSSEGQYGATLSANSNTLKERVELMKQQLEIEKENARIKNEADLRQQYEDSIKDSEKFNGKGLLGFVRKDPETKLRERAGSVGTPNGNNDEIYQLQTRIDKVKSLEEAEKRQAEAQKLLAEARKNGDQESISSLDRIIGALDTYKSKKAQATVADNAAIDAQARLFTSKIEQIKNANYSIGDSGKAILISLSSSVRTFSKSGEDAKNTFSTLNGLLTQDAGFASKMQEYEAALNSFKNAKNETERADRLP
ncbi:hypothetical protein FXW04_06320, partial [Staphylococcus pseudintermedius]|nr:hypothetical protein [Staphylococcus pseudintermedius]